MAAVVPLVMTATGQLQRIQSGDAIPLTAGGTGATTAAAARTALGLGDLDTDGTMAANSDTRIPSQKAVRTYVAANAGGGTGATRKTYALRGDLRSMTPTDGAQAVVEELGYFVYVAGATELDDDETCFATASGRWLLQAIAWGMMESYVQTIREDIEYDVEQRYATLPTEMLYGSASVGGASVTALTGVSFTITVTGCTSSHHVNVTPPAGGVGGTYLSMSYAAGTNQVTVYIKNHHATVADSYNGGTWRACAWLPPT